MITVVIPIFNTAPYLRKCLESVIHQTYSDLEIILINDGSTDNSEQLCLEYADKDNRIIYIRKKNEGPGSVRNLGIQLAHGEYFTTIDSDDWWDLTFCAKLLQAAQQFNADITLCDFMNVEMNNDTLLSQTPSRMRITPNRTHCAKQEPVLVNTCRTIFWGKLYKSAFLKTIQIEQPHTPFEDMATTPLITVLADRIVRIPEILYYYLRNRSDSITNLPSTKRYFVHALKLIVSHFQEHGLFEHYQQELLKKNHSDVRFVISKMNISSENDEQRDIQNELCTFLSSTYPQWVNVEKHTFTVIGSEQLQIAVKRFLFHPERARYFSNIETAIADQALYADYLFIDCNEGLEQLPNFPKETSLFLIGEARRYQPIHTVCRMIRIDPQLKAEDEDCACWDLSDAIFHKL